MVIIVDRFISDNDTTISRVMVDGKFICFGLEDEYREDKVPGETRIPSGTYKITLRTEGTFNSKYAIRFAGIHKGMLHIMDVPNFQYILIHCGNTSADTAGCLLVGSQAITEPGDMKITGSTAAYMRFYPMVVDAAASNNLSITFLDNDHPERSHEVNSDASIQPILPPSGENLTQVQIDDLFNWNAEQRNKMAVGAGSLVGALISELEKTETYIKIENPVSGGYICDYIVVQGRKDLIAPIGIALGFKAVTGSTLEVYNA